MKKLLMRTKIISLIIALWAVSFAAFAATNNAALAQSIEKIIAKYGPGVNIGIQVQSLNTGNIVYQRNPNQLFSPASSLKTFTAAAALSYLGPNYTFKTRVLAAPHSLQQGVLNSDVYFYFDGDPTLKREDLDELFSVLNQLGVQTIKGNIYIDDSVFDQDEFGPGWMWDERSFCYAAPLTAISIDHNCFPFTVSAPKQVGRPLIISKSKDYAFVDFINHTITSNASYEDCPLTLRGIEDSTYILEGCVKPGTRSFGLSVATIDMRSFTVGTFESLLRQHNIRLLGSIKFSKVPTDKQLAVLGGRNSESLAALVKIMLKKSDNLIADAIYKKLGYAYFNKPGTWSNGAKALNAIIGSNASIDFKKIRIVDGCGLSRHNLITPQTLVSLMNYVYRDQAIRDYFIASLPIGGVDGHLQNRMANIKGKVRAKTGTMKSITSLAGYIYTNSGQVLSFAIIVNDFTESVKKYQRLEDEICAVLVNR